MKPKQKKETTTKNETADQTAESQTECVAESGGGCSSGDKPKSGSYSVLGE